MTTKILALTDVLGNLVRFMLLPGHRLRHYRRRAFDHGAQLGGLIADKVSGSDASEMNVRAAKIILSHYLRPSKPLVIDTKIYRWRQMLNRFAACASDLDRRARCPPPYWRRTPCTQSIKDFAKTLKSDSHGTVIGCESWLLVSLDSVMRSTSSTNTLIVCGPEEMA